MPGLPGTRNSPESPDTFSTFRIVGINKAADACLTARNASKNLTIDGDGRPGDRVADLVVRHFGIPADRAGLGVERDQMRV